MSIPVPGRLEPQRAEAKFLHELGFGPSSSGNHVSNVRKIPSAQSLRSGYLNAGDLTTFLSQIKYLNSEFDAVDLGPHPMLRATTFGEQRAVITKQSARVRSQLELKFNCISLMTHAATQTAQSFSRQVDHGIQYNPLQTIRNRSRRPPAFSVPEPLLWHISVSEQVKDFSWRYKRARRSAPKSGHSKSSSIESEGSEDSNASAGSAKAGAGSAKAGAGSAHKAASTGSAHSASKENSTGSANLSKPGSFSKPSSVKSTGGTSISVTNPSASTPTSISRGSDGLRKSNTNSNSSLGIAQTGNAARRSSRLAGSRSRSFTQLPPSDCGELIARLRKAHDDDDDEQAIEIHDNSGRRRRSSGGCSSGSTRARFSRNENRHGEETPVLKVTSEEGSEQVLSSNEGNVVATSGRASSTSSSITGTQSAQSSLRPSAFESRKDPWERAMATLESELRFLKLFYTFALNRHDPQDQCDRLASRFQCTSRQEKAAAMSETLKAENVPAYLRYLSAVEQEAVNTQQRLDAQVATIVDGLRVSTDLMVSEVNTTLNRKMRSLTSRMEKQCNTHECSLLTTCGYAAIEYSVMFAMWVCWIAVKLWKALVAVLRFTTFLAG